MVTPSVPAFKFTFVAVLLQSSLDGFQQRLVELVSVLTPIEVAAIGGGGVTSVAAVRWLIKRAATDGVGTTTPTAVSTTTSTTTTSPGSAGKHKVAFTLPGILPVSKGIRQVTHNEIHAIELGFVVGLVSTWLYNAGHTEPVFAILVAFIAGSLGFKRYGSKAFKTIRLEPWYALLALLGGGALGWAIFMREPGLITVLGV